MNIPVIKKYEMENLFLKQYLHVYEENKQTNKQTCQAHLKLVCSQTT